VAEIPGPYSIGSDLWPGLSRLVEELGELSQVAGKLIGNGGETAHYDGTDLRARLAEEIADVLAAMSFVADSNGLDHQEIEKRAEAKRDTYE
jgi:NTP pyrophosphatase (non-canonical NTP hydrolase)